MLLHTWQVLSLLAVVLVVIGLAYFLGVEVGKGDRDGTRIKA